LTPADMPMPDLLKLKRSGPMFTDLRNDTPITAPFITPTRSESQTTMRGDNTLSCELATADRTCHSPGQVADSHAATAPDWPWGIQLIARWVLPGLGCDAGRSSYIVSCWRGGAVASCGGKMFTKVANSPGRLLVCFALTLGCSSVLYSVTESANLLDSLYWSIVTATTLGYGDFSPHTTGGKVLTSVLICLMVFLFIPTITANLASKLIVNRDVFTHDEQEQIKDGIADLQRAIAALTATSEPEAS
jgi:voltage-gated potassium channel